MKRGPKPKESKVCPVCLIEKPRADFYKKLDTISHKCKVCSLADMKARQAQYFGRYTERQNAWRREQYAKTPTTGRAS
jgi:hypothetical protein